MGRSRKGEADLPDIVDARSIWMKFKTARRTVNPQPRRPLPQCGKKGNLSPQIQLHQVESAVVAFA